MMNRLNRKNANRRRMSVASVALCAIALVVPGAISQDTTQAERLADYVARARESATINTPTTGSLWTPNGRFSGLAIDYKSRNVNDLIVIHVLEQTIAEAAGSLSSSRDFEASSGISELFGQVGIRSGLQALFSPSSNNSLQGQAQTASNSLLSTSLSGHVVEVLPNGYLVVEAARDLEMNNEQQSVVVRGVVRPGDVAPDNSVLSTAISLLEVDLTGDGVISDGVRPTNRWIGGLLRILGF